jgi:hypothetical protein
VMIIIPDSALYVTSLSASGCFSCGTPTRHTRSGQSLRYIWESRTCPGLHALQLACRRNACCRSHSLSPPWHRGPSSRPHYSARRRRSPRRDGRRTLPNCVRLLREPSSISGNYDWQMPRWMAKKKGLLLNGADFWIKISKKMFT